MIKANNNIPNDNGSQFFITFDQCNWLNRKHSIFGKVVGDTIFNLLAMEHLDTDGEDRPLSPPKILSSKVLINPFDDIIQRNKVQNKPIQPKEEKMAVKIKEKPSNLTKNINLLSFDHEEEGNEEDDDDLNKNNSKKKKNEDNYKIKSSHDVLQDPKLSKEPAISLEKLSYDQFLFA